MASQQPPGPAFTRRRIDRPGLIRWLTVFRRRPVMTAISLMCLSTSTALVRDVASAFAKVSPPPVEHRVVIQIDSDDERAMGHAISYPINIARSYAQRNEAVRIEVVANGSGIRLLRADDPRFQQALAYVLKVVPGIVLSMCASSKDIAEAREGHPIALIGGARLVPFGIGRVVELEEEGWSYVHG